MYSIAVEVSAILLNDDVAPSQAWDAFDEFDL